MHKVKVTIYHLTKPNLLNWIEEFIGSTTNYWGLIGFKHYKFEGKTEVIYNVKSRGLMTFKEVYANVIKNSKLNLSKLQFKYLEE